MSKNKIICAENILDCDECKHQHHCPDLPCTCDPNLADQRSVNVDQRVMPDACGQWQTEKPNKPCLMVTRTFYDGYNYQLFELNYMEGYLAIFCNDGIEWGDYSDLKADEYFIIEYYDSKHSA